MKKGYLVLLVCLFCIPLFAHAQSGSDVIVFADPVLETKICKAIGKTNGPITYAEAEKVTELNLGNETKDDESQMITDLSGMENFPNIFNLSAYNNNISDVTPLSKIAGLKYLDLGGNSISDLSPFEGHYFEALNLWGNNINDVTPMLNITVNQRLYLNDNIISDVSGLTSQTKLQTLILGNNFITDFSPIADMCKNIEEIDFDPSTPQVSFTLDDYSVINEEIYFPDPMFEACVRKFFGFPDDMAITVKDVCFSGFLKADDSQEVPDDQKITDITGIEYFYSLEGLQIYHHSISDITPIANLNKLTYIDLGGNHISDISALAGHYMNSVSLWGNNITDIT
ncbi:MAG: leucine-rich repeat domain-containing protein, partial [Bacteroidales bacterium]|nr:leucine-rich repeat domain-containing protein [Bacteroidales bacterium]